MERPVPNPRLWCGVAVKLSLIVAVFAYAVLWALGLGQPASRTIAGILGVLVWSVSYKRQQDHFRLTFMAWASLQG